MSANPWVRIGRQIGSKWKNISPVENLIQLNGGLPYESLDPSGTGIRPYSLLRMTEMLRIGSFWGNRTFMDIDRLKCLVFIVTSTIDINKDLYQDSVVKLDHPMSARLTLSYFGRSSFRFDTSFYHSDFTNPIIQSGVQSVIINPATRKPMPFPDWFREKYEPYCIGGEALIKPHLELPKLPQNISKHIVQYSELDVYKHTNWCSYMTICQNALAVGIAENKYKHITSELMSSGLKSFSAAYKKESKFGDVLEIYSWEDGEKTVHFTIKTADDICVQATFHF